MEKKKPDLICGGCGYNMKEEIEEWFEAEGGLIPHPNRTHPCPECGHEWRSSDGLVEIEGYKWE